MLLGHKEFNKKIKLGLIMQLISKDIILKPLEIINIAKLRINHYQEIKAREFL
jgi:hypothetical protein